METTKAAVTAAFVLVFSMAMAPSISMAQTTAQDQEFVSLHNAARREVGVEDVVWDETAARYARDYAAVRAADCGLTHTDQDTRDSLGYGENIMVGPPGSDLTVAETVQTWWVDNEKRNFDAASGTCMVGRPEELRCGHYTQVVWRDTKAIGCARAKRVNGGVFINCYYTPAGNVLNQRPF